MKQKHHVKLGKHLKKIENFMTEIQRHLDEIYAVSNHIYDEFINKVADEVVKKPKKKLKKAA